MIRVPVTVLALYQTQAWVKVEGTGKTAIVLRTSLTTPDMTNVRVTAEIEPRTKESDRLRGLILAFVEKARLKSTAEGWCNLTAEFQAFDALRRERDRADAPPAHDLTPSEVFLAKVLAAWEAWPGRAAGGSLGEEAPVGARRGS